MARPAIISSWQVFYKTLPYKFRLRTQTVVESIIKPIVAGLAGIALLAFSFPGSVERELAAQLFGAIQEDRANGLLSQLLQDDKLQVRRAALAAGKFKRPELWPIIIVAGL
jgi:hypothetical protein